MNTDKKFPVFRGHKPTLDQMALLLQTEMLKSEMLADRTSNLLEEVEKLKVKVAELEKTK